MRCKSLPNPSKRGDIQITLFDFYNYDKRKTHHLLCPFWFGQVNNSKLVDAGAS